MLWNVQIANSNRDDVRPLVRIGTESPLRASKMADFSATWWSILTKFGDMIGDHSAHQNPEFRQDPSMYAISGP